LKVSRSRFAKFLHEIVRVPPVAPSQVPSKDELGMPLDSDVAVGVPSVRVGDLPPRAGALFGLDECPKLICLYVLDGDRLDLFGEHALTSFAHLDKQTKNGLLLRSRDTLNRANA
jgi:hypothetical protein